MMGLCSSPDGPSGNQLKSNQAHKQSPCLMIFELLHNHSSFYTFVGIARSPVHPGGESRETRNSFPPLLYVFICIISYTSHCSHLKQIEADDKKANLKVWRNSRRTDYFFQFNYSKIHHPEWILETADENVVVTATGQCLKTYRSGWKEVGLHWCCVFVMLWSSGSQLFFLSNLQHPIRWGQVPFIISLQ